MRTKIYTMTHKQFARPEDPTYVPLHVGRAGAQDLGYTGDHTGDSISRWNAYYGELTGVYWVWKNETDADIIGICHYRRFFLDENRQLLKAEAYENILKDHDIMVSNSVEAPCSYQEYFGEAHNVEDLLTVGEVIKEKTPEYYPYFEAALRGRNYYYGNLMVAKKEVFEQYASWLFSILFEVEQRIDVSGYDMYNQRVFGFLSEQMLKVFVDKNQLKVYEGTIGVTAEKAETVELKLALGQLVKMREYTQARTMFYEMMKIRPDVRLELSDIKGELPIIEQLLYIAEEEKKQGVDGLEKYSDQLTEWIRHFREVYEILTHFSKGRFSVREEQYIKDTHVSWIMAKIMLLNAAEGCMEDPQLALDHVIQLEG